MLNAATAKQKRCFRQ